MRTIKKKYNIINRGSTNNRFIQLISIAILILFTLHLYVLPSAFSLTVEEKARQGPGKSRYSTNDEFIKKTPARRTSSITAQEKDPRLACLLSLIVPGGGQIYLKKDLKWFQMIMFLV